MLLKEKLTKMGDLFFRWRSYIPLGLVILLFLEREHSYYLGSSHVYDTMFEVFCLLIALFGFIVRVITVGNCRRGTSGRNTKANKG